MFCVNLIIIGKIECCEYLIVDVFYLFLINYFLLGFWFMVVGNFLLCVVFFDIVDLVVLFFDV